MAWSTPPGAYGTADPLFLLLIALAVEAYVGGRPLRLPFAPSPRRAVARLVLGLERRLNRPERGPRALRARGLLLASALAAGALGLGWLAALVTRNYPFAWAIELFVLVLLVDQRATWTLAARVRAGLRSGSLVRAREALRPLAAGRLAPGEIDVLDAAAVTHTGVAALGRRFARRLVAPVFWYVLLGLAGLFVQQSAHVAAATLSVRAGPFAQAARRLDAALGYAPDRLAALLLATAAAFVPGTRPLAGLRSAFAGPAPAAAALTAALAPGPAAESLSRGLAVFAIACLIDGGLIALLALARLAL